ncbi:PREDICTED: uncharacterized protein LOC104593388 isoform X1 [Nelumbo nucifera]|uniref:Uncharacterized protein LOC104593388 isoform X1 n=3 Tax=Nelumbo nucifera TaxID=4432 RepID=A0A1U7ZF36_NELNU|nr:PREDICTED: uncharacterized protein LOC104593388 isoform X1 [Nelumbo nucifera]
MFEGLVRQLLLGYLGRYVKDIHKEQLKIGLWNGEVLLENVELILEAFDYLQLPFALKQGHVGRLSIKIPWKKLGWDPIIIVLEDVFMSACRRDDNEWSLDSVERREYAGKKAKLATAELAKLSRRVCDNQAGQSFISYITAKILEGIQVSIKNVHVVYVDEQSDSARSLFGLRFSSLTVTKQNSVGLSGVKLRGGQVNKIVEISSLGIYCSTSLGTLNIDDDNGNDSQFCNARFECGLSDYILAPFDVAVSLVVNRSGKVENGIPQYSVRAEINALVMSLNEVQMQRILIVWDYLCICQLRKKYGRYRPWCSPLSRKLKGWQKLWWHYAQESVLSDVHSRLRKTSWRYFGWRISYCRKYVNLYKTKLNFLRQELPVDEITLLELERMEKECDVDDILRYRSIAECELQESLLNSASSNMGTIGTNVSMEKQQNDECLLSRSRGWLNWLSLGVLGAGGTADSSQFSGVVSDEVIKDIYEATKFHLLPSVDGDASGGDKTYVSNIKFNIHQINATIGKKGFEKESVHFSFGGIKIKCNHWEESATIHGKFSSLEIIDPCTKNTILVGRKVVSEEASVEYVTPFMHVQVDMSLMDHDSELGIKVVLQPFEMTYDSEFILNLLDFHHILQSFQFQHERVLSSLNGFEKFERRILLKSQYVLLNRKRMTWDVNFKNVIICFPWRNDYFGSSTTVFGLGAVMLRSRLLAGSISDSVDQDGNLFKSLSSTSDKSFDVQIHDIYDHFEILLNNFEVKIVLADRCQEVSLFERANTSIILESCIIPDESALKQLQVKFLVSSLNIHFSPLIYGVVLGFLACLDLPEQKSQMMIARRPDILDVKSGKQRNADVYQFSVAANFELVTFLVGMSDNVENNLVLKFALGELEIQYVVEHFIEECTVFMKTLNIITSAINSEGSSQILCSSRNTSSANQAHYNDMDVTHSNASGILCEQDVSSNKCFLLHYEAQRSLGTVYHRLTICFSDVDLHCYPNIFGPLLAFCDRLSEYGTSSGSSGQNSFGPYQEVKDDLLMSVFELQRFGFSNFCESELAASPGIPLDHFPFVTVRNSDPLCNTEMSRVCSIVRDKKYVRRPKFRIRKKSKICLIPKVVYPSIGHEITTSGISSGTGLFAVDLELNGIRVHFHDSSCILCTITLPVSKSLLFFHGIDCWDILCSVEGLVLSSSWCNQNFREVVWDSSLPNISSVLNIRLKKVNARALSDIKISISIQHVCCVLMSEFLAMLIGYFSLPDWSSAGNTRGATENVNFKIESKICRMICKFEILGSTLILPLESNVHHSLQLELQQLYCTFIPRSSSEDGIKNIPQECLASTDKIADRVHLLNAFGQDLSLSLLLIEDERHVSPELCEDGNLRKCLLIKSLDGDLWIRIPCVSTTSPEQCAVPVCVMTKIHSCQLIAEDCYLFYGIEALLNMTNQISAVGTESECFTYSVLQFLQTKKSLKEQSAVIIDRSNVTFVDIRCCINSLSVQLCRSRGRDSFSSELVAKADMQLTFSASFRNGVPLSFDIDFSDLILYSFHSSVILVKCTSSGSFYSGLDIHFSNSDQGENVLVVGLPSLDIWLHSSDWSEVTAFLCSLAAHHTGASNMMKSSENLNLDSSELVQNETLTMLRDPIDLIVKSVNMGLSIHFPLWVKEKVPSRSEKAEVQQEIYRTLSSNIPGERTSFQAGYCKYLAVTLHSRKSQFVISGGHVKLDFNVDKMNGILETMERKEVFSSSLFQLCQVNVAAEINYMQPGIMHANFEVQMESLVVWLSYQMFYFCHDIEFKISDGRTSEFSFGNFVLDMHLRKASLLLTDGRSCNAPLLVIVIRSMHLHANITQNNFMAVLSSDLVVNYNNIQKVMWEPFMEPWNFQLSIMRKVEKSALMNTSIITDIQMKSLAQLNLNFTESLFEVFCRGKEMIEDAWNQAGPNDYSEGQGFLEHQTIDNVYTRKYAPYVLQNETSLPLSFQVYFGSVTETDFDVLPKEERNIVQPGTSVPIYIDESPEEQIFGDGPGHSSDRLGEKKSTGVLHHLISIQLHGTSRPSPPISMDIVGLRYFEVDFCNASDKIEINKSEGASIYSRKVEEKNRIDPTTGFLVPVVFDVSIQRYSKLVRLYSTVELSNATTMPLELRFDIPFGVSPKVLDPIYPGQQFALPLHLAESGRIRWRPVGNGYLWSEAHQLSDILSQENRLGYLRSFVCYPSHPSSDPFRCCLSIQDVSLTSSIETKKGPLLHFKEASGRQPVKSGGQTVNHPHKSEKRFLHQVTLTAPLLVKNYLPRALSMTIESGGVARTVLLSEVKTVSLFHIDSTHDLGIVFHMDEFMSATSKFPRAEKFTELAKFNENKLSSSETLAFYPSLSNGVIYVMVEKVMDACSGAREICISVPFLLYNFTGLPLIVTDSANEMKGNILNIPSCYYFIDQEQLLARKQGIGFVSSEQDSYATSPTIGNLNNSLLKNNAISLRQYNRFPCKDFIPWHSPITSHQHIENRDLLAREAAPNSLKNILDTTSELSVHSSGSENTSRKIQACMYSPHPSTAASELMVRLSTSFPESLNENIQSSSWSSPFFLVPSGSTSVLVPQPSTTGAFIISVTSGPVAGPVSASTRAITFQPRYVISNACQKNISFKQKGTDLVSHLVTGQHSHLHWADTTRDLLISIRFNEPGWLWSGSFLPDHLGDTQLKMRNVSGALSTIRVEVQDADVSIIKDKRTVDSSHGMSGTYLILLSDDNTGFMPYRVDNFSKERLRIYQQKCETFETMVHSYTSCPYAWDEPCYPHRLVVEVPGERILGSFILDHVKEYTPICLPSTTEKTERRFFLSIHAEGAVKVLSVIDSSLHFLKDMKETQFPGFKNKRNPDQEGPASSDYRERIVVHLSFIGISLINSYPQELLFASAKDTKIEVLQNVHQQKFSFQISSLQIDNQLHNTPYPVILSMDHVYRGNSSDQLKSKDDSSKIKNANVMHTISESPCGPMLFLAAAKWRNKDISLVSFEYITLRLAALRLDLEEEVILSLFDFARTVISRLQIRTFKYPGREPLSVNNLFGNRESSPALPSVGPIGAPWQQIYLLARRKEKIYVEVFDLSPIKLTLSFSSTPWMHRNVGLTSPESLIHFSSTAFQRGLMAIADVEGAPVYLRQLTITHHMASWESIQEVLIRHYTRQFLHEMYKVFGSAGVIGNPMGFARNVGLGIKEFFSVPIRSIFQSPAGVITSMAQGTTSLLSNTIYAVSNAATQFSKAAHKGIVAFTFDDQYVAKMEKQQKRPASHSKGVLNEFLEGLTGLLQSPIRGAEKHGLPGVLSGIALGTAGVVARPMASILEVTGKTAQSIRNQSNLYQTRRFRVRLPRPLSRELPLRPYSWEEAIGTSLLLEAGDGKLKDEVFVKCKTLKQSGNFVVITERLILVVRCSSLKELGTPEFCGVADPDWVIETEIGLDSVIHADREENVVNVVGSSSETVSWQQQLKRSSTRTKNCSTPTILPLSQTSMELMSKEDAEDILLLILSTVERGKEQGWGIHVLHQGNVR